MAQVELQNRIGDFRRQKKQGAFHMSDLNDFVAEELIVAPDTPGRVMRGMRTAGKINYVLLDRRSSLYQFV